MGRNVSMSKRADDRNDKNSMGITAGCDIAEDTAKKSEAQAGAQEEARAAQQASASAQAAAVHWTPEQAEAITRRGQNLLVAAAAGSGKTAVLVFTQ